LKDFFDKQNKYYGINGVGSIGDITTLICNVFEKL
jgi:adenylate kinase